MAAIDGQFHVLVVDDSRVDRVLVERRLKASSFRVTAVDSPVVALQVLQSNNVGINLILTDYNMPEMTGYELIISVRALPSPARNIPVVVMSATEAGRRCLEVGARYFFPKPVNQSDVDILRSYLEANNNGAT